MRWSVGRRLLVGLVLVLVGCESGEVGPTPADPLAGFVGRQLVIPVENSSALPARLIVAEDRSPIGRVVGIVQPSVIAPRTRVNVSFLVPESPDWAIFVNPGPEMGPLLLQSDLRGCIGRLPIEIGIDRTGSPFWSSPGANWCGAANNP
jgi:hypothetical protein